MIYKHSHIFNIFKHISFVLVLCVLILQPITEAFSSFSDVNYELVDIDWEDDTDKEEKEGKSEQKKKIEPQFVNANTSYSDLYKYAFHYYIQRLKLSNNLEILIPPPELA